MVGIFITPASPGSGIGRQGSVPPRRDGALQNGRDKFKSTINCLERLKNDVLREFWARQCPSKLRIHELVSTSTSLHHSGSGVRSNSLTLSELGLESSPTRC